MGYHLATTKEQLDMKLARAMERQEMAVRRMEEQKREARRLEKLLKLPEQTPTGSETKPTITLTSEQNAAMRVLLSGKSVFLTGKAGTGKSYLTRAFIEESKKAGKNILVCAPTGIAALNVGGATLHRTFAVPTEILNTHDECKKEKNLKIIDKADIILIDEISMCRIDLFRFVAKTIVSSQDRTGRKKQVVVVGDFFQLPPVLKYEEKKDFQKIYGKKLYAFESLLWQEMGFMKVELSEVVRQKDPDFMTALNKIREGISDFSIFPAFTEDDLEAITICGRNDEADQINRQQLSRLTKKRIYEARCYGLNDAPTAQSLELGEGARVIMLANDEHGRWANGTLAVVTALLKDRIMIKVAEGNEYEVEYYTWETKEYELRKRSDGSYVIETYVTGSFSQIPVKLAYAITIHRSQGQTYDKVNIHPEGIFAEGQLYVALSRGRSLKGIRIIGKLTEKQLKVSGKVVDFYKAFNTLMTTTCQRGGQENVKTKEVVIKENTERGGQENVKKERKRSFSTYIGKTTRNRILDLIKDNPYITSLKMVKYLNMNRSAIQKHLVKLAAEGWLIRSGSKKTGRWEVVDAIEIPP